MLCDLHTHSAYSHDSETPMSVHCKRAIELGIDCICFTEHLDYNPVDPGYRLFNPDAYFAGIEQARENFGDKLLVLAGAEFSEPHLYPKELDACRKYPFDMIMGSVHFWIEDLFPSQMPENDISAQEAFDRYWRELLLTVKAGGFDVVGHMDYPKRFYHHLLYEKGCLEEIFGHMQENDIIPEINCGGLRRKFPEPNPGEILLQLYKDGGDKMVTLGSDSHKAESLGYGLQTGKELVQIVELQEVYIKAHKRIFVNML